jgi:cellulose synthase/poly-beta-1,6-N-acetylglucosamine synthase-like glycosyltransferase
VSVLLHVVHLFLVFIAFAMAVPVAVLAIEVVASLLPRRYPQSPALSAPCSLAVVVPAHDEGENLLPTLTDIRLQLGPHDRLIVIADNCTDNTAEIAGSAGATVLVRTDPLKRGKGYALSFAIEQLSKDPPDYVIFIDADCRLDHTVLGRLRDACGSSRRPVQACYLMKQPEGTPLDHRLAEFTWLIRNYVRPLGLRALGLPTQLMGSGMIFPWPVIASAPLASADIVEDLNLGLDLAAAGHPPIFLPDVAITSSFAASEAGRTSQRERWIFGHLKTIVGRAPLLLVKAVRTFNPALFALGLDLLVPPLSLFGFLLVLLFIASAVVALASGRYLAILLSAADFLALFAAVFLAWFAFGRAIFPLSAMHQIGSAVAARIRLYILVACGKASSAWVRTDRRNR